MKVCFKCSRTLPIDCFYRHPQMQDGHLGKCKECTLRDVREHREANWHRVAAYDKKRKAGNHARKTRRDPIKSYATNVTAAAIRDGKLIRQPCEVCGMEKVQAHHDDYTKPLDVRWLCFRHHRERHGQRTAEARQ